MDVCVCVCVCVCTCTYVCMCVCRHICVYKYVRTRPITIHGKKKFFIPHFNPAMALCLLNFHREAAFTLGEKRVSTDATIRVQVVVKVAVVTTVSWCV